MHLHRVFMNMQQMSSQTPKPTHTHTYTHIHTHTPHNLFTQIIASTRGINVISVKEHVALS